LVPPIPLRGPLAWGWPSSRLADYRGNEREQKAFRFSRTRASSHNHISPVYDDLSKNISLMLIKGPARSEQALGRERCYIRDFALLPNATEKSLRGVAE
jgi:hypothetical protein